MKKRSRRPRLAGRTAAVASEEKKGSRGRPQKTVALASASFYGDEAAKLEGMEERAEGTPRAPGRLSAVCRLCHGKFSPRSLRHAFVKCPRDAAAQSDEPPLLFHDDFQRLVGVALDRDPRLSDFICKKCHAKFYKCHGILLRFLQRVNLPPAGAPGPPARRNLTSPETSESLGPAGLEAPAPPSFTSDQKCLTSLVLWTHQHAEACRSCPGLKEVLGGQCWGAVWSCVDGHSYTMDARYADASNISVNYGRAAMMLSSNGEGELMEEEEQEQPSAGGPAATPQSSLMENWRAEGFSVQQEALSPALLEAQAADSDLSDRAPSEEAESDSSRRGGGGVPQEEEELFVPYAHRASKRRPAPPESPQPRARKRPGPKPGWKNKFKPKGEELPNIYKCPYQGCTAVYRAPDGLKKHIKEHHEEVRERPCPHPGCNKVFMIDRYLQRHVKLIHTEERNYICDQCGQTFKQRKHLSVHQMRHSGAKPLQCEVCGFQCRQRASLKYHMTKHTAEADLEFECLMCRKRFEKPHNLNVHMSMVHPLTQTEVQRGAAQAPPTACSDLHGVQQEQDR